MLRIFGDRRWPPPMRTSGATCALNVLQKIDVRIFEFLLMKYFNNNCFEYCVTLQRLIIMSEWELGRQFMLKFNKILTKMLNDLLTCL